MLPLYGMAVAAHGYDLAKTRQVLRLRSPKEGPEHLADVALIRQPEDFDLAAVSGFLAALLIGDGSAVLPKDPRFLRVIQLARKFDYLAEGDILGFQPGSKRFRTLYRRSSEHNSFLVTERCNHYCLMCSQPPRDID